MHRRKILPLPALAEALAAKRAAGKTIVHCHGVFDLLHIGHIRYLAQARDMGDVLVVTISPDRFVDKGPYRPAFTQDMRAEGLASLASVDYVAVNDWPTAEETLRLLKPHIYVKGSDFKGAASDRTGKLAREEAVVREIGARMAFTDDVVFSSSNLINRYFSSFSAELQDYLNIFRQRHPLEDILAVLDRMSGLRVLVVGDAILDEYCYCEAIGKSSKDPVLALKHKSSELFAGGALAVANQVARFASEVRLLTVLGGRDSREDFIRERLSPRVNPLFAVRPDAPTILKRRYLDAGSLNKLLEVYVMNGSSFDPGAGALLSRAIREEAGGFDLVIASDFGHYSVSPPMVEAMAEAAPYLAVNTQANAGNRGLHTVSRYPRVDYACLAEHELRLEARDETGALRAVMDRVGGRIGCDRFAVTRGRDGCVVWTRAGDFLAVPSFTPQVVDRIGAGDAFLSVTALAARLGAPLEVQGFLGNVVGSLAVEVVGNKKAIDRQNVEKFVTALLK